MPAEILVLCQVEVRLGEDTIINGYELEVLVHGHPCREYVHEGSVWIEGRPSSEYTLRVKNNSDSKILAVVSVDGLSVMDGKEASRDSGGYVIWAKGRIDIPGWRLSNDAVAKFCFSEPSSSYAQQMGKAQNLGVVGCMVFEERPLFNVLSYGSSTPRWEYSPIRCSSSKSTASLGTSFGDTQDNKVREVGFYKQDVPSGVMSIRYGDRGELVRRGIDLTQRPEISRGPNPFPAEKGCVPPPNWTGK